LQVLDGLLWRYPRHGGHATSCSDAQQEHVAEAPIR
jgi:hypothetical protein